MAFNSNYTPGEPFRIANLVFPGYSVPVQDFFMGVHTYTSKLVATAVATENICSFVGIILNTFHFIILTRKSMRNSSTNIIMASLAVHDILAMIFTLAYNLRPAYNLIDFFCAPPNTLSSEGFAFLKNVIRSFFRRSSSWLMISMAVIRALSIRLFDNSNFSFLSTAKFGLTVIFIELISSLCFLLIPFFPFILKGRIYDPERDMIWTPKPSCPDYDPNRSSVEHVFEISANDRRRNELVDGFAINFVPCVLYLIFTILLVIELEKMKSKRAKLKQEKKQDRTTKIVIVMVICFLIAELPQALGAAIYFFGPTSGFNILGTNMKVGFSFLSLLNSCTHCVICFCLSSNYRSAIGEFCGISKKTKTSAVKLNSIRSTSSTGTAQSVTVTQITRV